MTQGLDWRVFETTRLRFVPFSGSAEERSFCLKALNINDVVMQLNEIPQPYTDESFDEFAQWHAQQSDDFLWSVRRKEQPNTVIAHVNLRAANADGLRTIAYFSDPDFGRKGYMAEAVAAMVEFGFDVLETKTLLAEIYDDNPRSLALINKLGFEFFAKGESTTNGRTKCVRYPHSEFAQTAEQFRQHRMRDGCHTYTAIVHRELPIITVAAAALVNPQGELLVAQRPKGKSMAGLWEFPGGKLEPGETPEAALIRELGEELGIDTDHSCLSPVAFASHSYPKFHLMMPVFAIRQWRGEIKGMEGQATQWIAPKKLWSLPMPPADEPIIPLLIDLL